MILAPLLLVAATLGSEPPGAILARAQALMVRGEYQGALAELERIPVDDRLTTIERARLYEELAAARSQTGADERALADADRAERAAQAANAYDLLARIESVRGIVWLNRGRALESLRHMQRCANWAQRSRQPILIAGASIRLAAAYQDLGDWTRALDAVNRAFEADRTPVDAARMQYLTRRGLVEIELREGDAAKADIREALALARKVGDRRSEAQILIDLALAVERVDRDPAAAAGHAADAVAITEQLRLPPLEIAARNQLGSLYRESGRLADARRQLAIARAEIARYRERRDEPYVLKNLGQALVRLGQVAEGARVLRQAADRADAANLTRVRWLARLELAELDVARDPVAADREFQQALAVLEEQQTNVLLEGFRSGALDQALFEHDPYDRYIQFLVGRGEPERAFYVAERERARVFLDRLSGAREALAARVPAGFADEENALLGRINANQTSLRTGRLDDPTRRRTLEAVDRDEAQLVALRLRLAADRPELANARYPTLWSLDEVRSRLLRPDERLVSYFLGAERSLCWIVGRDRTTTIVLPPRGEIEARIRAALLELRDPEAGAGTATAALAGALQLDRVTAAGPAARLVFVPHAALYDVPFEALPAADGRPLVERYAISYAPSASSLAFLRSLPRFGVRPTTLVAVGDPVVRAAAAARLRQAELTRVDLLTPLPHSAEEVRAIAALFRPAARVLTGPNATEAALRDGDLGRVRILHFATHGLIDEIHPDRSGLVLTAAPPDDGILQTREIYSLPLQADLVTLSACQTALGLHATGEGIIGLTRAFFYAGARSVVASLWDIEDASTARLMERFYANVRAGDPIDVALQRAKVEVLRRGGPTARPFYWAAFVVSGEAATVVDVTGTVRRRVAFAAWAALALAVVLLAAISLALYRKGPAR